ncbi:MAG: diguanylate cyclase (GGDEF)-like protein [Phenylobacterium sp.]|jgi:diguanylate cyclase (GGDEF)-like protein
MDTPSSSHKWNLATLLWLIISVSLVIHLAVMVIGQTILADWRWPALTLHTSVEISGTITALFVAMFLLRYERFGQGTHYNVRIASALICMGVLDGFHALAAVGDNFVWLHSIATFIGGLVFMSIYIPVHWCQFNPKLWPKIAFVGSCAIGVASFMYPHWLPTMVNQGEFTTAAILLNIIGGVMLFAAAIRLILTWQQHKNTDDLLFSLHCFLFGAAAIMFQQSSLWDMPWWGWHVLRFLAYALALWFVIRGEGQILDELDQHRHHLTELVTQQTNKYQQSEAQLRVAQKIAHLGSWRNDITSNEWVWSDEFYRILGFSPNSFAPSLTTLVGIIHPSDKGRFLAAYEKTVEKGTPLDIECRIIHADKTIHHLHLSAELYNDEPSQSMALVGTAQDITEQKVKEAQIEHLANHDPLTDLPGLRLSQERMRTELARAKRNSSQFAVMFIDLDGFKQVNDSMGHQIGDELLIKVAKRLNRCLRDCDCIARIGGDEFLVIQTDVSNTEAVRHVAQKIISHLSTSYTMAEYTIEIGASIGIAMYPKDGDDPHELMKHADQAMYKVKKQGKNNFEFFRPPP